MNLGVLLCVCKCLFPIASDCLQNAGRTAFCKQSENIENAVLKTNVGKIWKYLSIFVYKIVGYKQHQTWLQYKNSLFVDSSYTDQYRHQRDQTNTGWANRWAVYTYWVSSIQQAPPELYVLEDEVTNVDIENVMQTNHKS